jgi:hypothetical protein
MRDASRVPRNDVPTCPDCQGDLSFVGSWTFRGLWGYHEVRTYECPTHGPIFVSPQMSAEQGPDKVPDHGQDNSDRDSLISRPRKPTPTLNTDAAAMPEPDSD